MAIVPPKCQKLHLYSHMEHLILTPHALSNKWGQGMLVVGTHCAPWLTSAFMRESTSLSRAVVMVSTDEQGVWGSHKSALFCYLVPSKPWQRTQTLLLWYYCGPTPYLLAKEALLLFLAPYTASVIIGHCEHFEFSPLITHPNTSFAHSIVQHSRQVRKTT